MSQTAKPTTVIMCLPRRGVDSMFAATAAVTEHLDGVAELDPRFPVRHRRLIGWITRWFSFWLVGSRRRVGAVRRAAGGRLRRLDLASAIKAAQVTALARWKHWHDVVDGAKDAKPFAHFLALHRAEPVTYPLEMARREFELQSQVLRMQLANAVPGTKFHLDPYELGVYQQGARTYATRHALTVIAGDAMLTADGEWLQPESTDLADTIAYLNKAVAHLKTLKRSTQIVALTI